MEGLIIWFIIIVIFAIATGKKKQQSTKPRGEYLREKLQNNPANEHVSEVVSSVEDGLKGITTSINRFVETGSFHVSDQTDKEAKYEEIIANASKVAEPESSSKTVASVRTSKTVVSAKTPKTAAPAKTPKAVAPQMKSSKKPEIVERAKQNANKYSADVTLKELELDHQHEERVAAAVTEAENRRVLAHEAYHLGDHEALDRETLLGSTEDLIVKGFDGNLSFQRDFLAEGLDMINRFV